MHLAVRLLAASAAFAALATARAAPADPVVLAEPGCPASQAFGGRPIASVDVRTPLAFLPWIAADLQRARALAAPLAGTVYSAEAVRAVQQQIGRLPFAELDREARVAGRVLAVVVACRPQGLELVFHVYVVQASKSVAITWEAQQRETAAPEQQGGQEGLRQGLRLQPRLGYQSGEGLGAGAAALYQRPDAAPGAYWHTLAFAGYASERLRDVSFAVEGWHEPRHGLWSHLSWRLGVADQSAPARAVSRLGQSGLSAQLLAQTRPLGRAALPLRLGAVLAAGQHRSGGQDNPAAGLAADRHTRSLKLMAGTTTRLDRHSLALSYGVELGQDNGGAAGIDWVKQIVDAAHQGRWRVQDHRNLSLDTRLTVGRLSERGVVPHAVRFFAGGREQRFTGGDTWQIRAAPLLRSLGTNALAGVAAAPGYRRFAALNLTAALPVYHVPLLPAELYSRETDVLPLLHGQLNTAQGALANTLRADLPAYRQAIAHLPQVQQQLAAMGDAVAAAGGAAEALTACRDQLEQARSDVAGVLEEPPGLAQLGLFADLLPPTQGSDTLGQVAALCADGFTAGARSPQIARQAAALRASIAQLEAWFAAASPQAADAAAAREIRPVRRIVDTLFKETNLVAVSPLLMLDVVALGPRPSGAPRTHVGLGTGVRVTLVDSMDLSLGYMANLRRQAGEARGAFFLSLEFKDPF